jgi:hypothetical protein
MATELSVATPSAATKRIQEFYGTGAAAIDHYMEVEANKVFRLDKISLKLSAGGAASNLVITVDDVLGTAYDYVIHNQTLSGITSRVLTTLDFGENFELSAGSRLTFAYANGGSATWGLTAWFTEV